MHKGRQEERRAGGRTWRSNRKKGRTGGRGEDAEGYDDTDVRMRCER